MKTEFRKFLLFAVISTIMFGSAVFAIAPGIPHQFFGSVLINGAPAPDGTIVSAKIGGTTVSTTATSGGNYGHSPNIFYVGDPNSNRAGSIIQFFVNGVDAGETAYFTNGKSTQVDLSVAIASQNSRNINTESGSSGSGSSGGGGSTSSSSATNNNSIASNNLNNTTSTTSREGPCQERWVCDKWSSCNDGIQKRSCTDANKCGTINDLPLITQPCSLDDVASANNDLAAQTGQTRISGLFLSATSSQGIIIIIFSALVIYFGFQYFRKNGSKKY